MQPMPSPPAEHPLGKYRAHLSIGFLLVLIGGLLTASPLAAQSPTPRRATSGSSDARAEATRRWAQHLGQPPIASTGGRRQSDKPEKSSTSQPNSAASKQAGSRVATNVLEYEGYGEFAGECVEEPDCLSDWSCGDDACGKWYNGKLWAAGDFLLWWTDSMGVPPLVTTGAAGTPPELAGVLGNPGTQVLFGDDDVDTGSHTGARLTFGWDCDCGLHGIEANLLALSSESSQFSASSDDFPILARPIVFNGANEAMLVAYPNLLEGNVSVSTSSELQSAEVFYRTQLFQGQVSRINLLLGYRFARLEESLRIDQFSEWIAPQANIIPGTTKDLFDLFETENRFNGGLVGLSMETCVGYWSFDVLLKLGLGNNHSEVTIDGSTVTTVPNAGSATFVGGLLAQSTNIGQYEQDEFALIPELGIRCSRDLTQHLRITVGYNLLYWTSVARPGDQIDLNVSQFPPEPPAGSQRPRFNFDSGSFWAQGLSCGVEYHF